MTDETYNGRTNRETWALNLWLSNDQGLCEMTRERVAQALDDPEISGRFVGYDDAAEDLARWRITTAADSVRQFVDELTDPDESLMTPQQIISLLSDVGSLYRVDWDEIGTAWLESIEEG